MKALKRNFYVYNPNDNSSYKKKFTSEPNFRNLVISYLISVR